MLSGNVGIFKVGRISGTLSVLQELVEAVEEHLTIPFPTWAVIVPSERIGPVVIFIDSVDLFVILPPTIMGPPIEPPLPRDSKFPVAVPTQPSVSLNVGLLPKLIPSVPHSLKCIK